MPTENVQHIPGYKFSTQWQDQNWILYSQQLKTESSKQKMKIKPFQTELKWRKSPAKLYTDLLLLMSMINIIKEVCKQKWSAVKELFA